MPSDVLITPATSKIDFTDGANSTKKLSISGTAFSFNSNLNVLSSTSLSSTFKAEGVNGTLFEVTDDLSNSLMSVNTIGGLPVFEVFANNSIIGGQYGANDFVISGNKIGLGYANPVNKLTVSGSVSIGSSYNVAAPSNGLIVQGNVGIGTVSPTNGTLQVYNASGNTLSLQKSGGFAALAMGSETTVYALIESINAGGIRFYTGNGTQTERWRITSAGILESTGAQTIRTSIDSLTLATNAGNGHILLSPHGTGNVGIGRASPQQKLHIAGTNARLAISNDSDNNWAEIGNDGSSGQNTLEFFTGSSVTSAMSITNANKVGIGTIAPVAKLHIGSDVEPNISNQTLFVQGSKTGYAGFAGLPMGSLMVYDDTASTAGSGGAISFGANTGSSQRTWIAAIESRRDSAVNDGTNYGGSLVFYTRPAQATPEERMRITSAGSFRTDLDASYHMGILNEYVSTYVSRTKFGRWNGTSNLELYYDIAGTEEARITRNYNTAVLKFNRSTTTDMVIDGTGNVGIGVGATLYKLEVNGNFAAGGTSTIGTTYPQLTLNGTANQHAYLMVNRTNYESGIQFQTSGTSKWWMYMPSGSDATLRFYTNQNSAGDILNLTNTGNVGVGTITPNSRLHVYNSSASSTIAANAIAVFEQDSNAGIQVCVPDSNEAGLFFSRSGAAYYSAITRSGTNLLLKNNSSTSMTINLNGNVGVGIADPTAKLDVTGSLTSGYSLLLRSGDSYNQTDSVQIAFGFANQTNYRHSIRTRHNPLAAATTGGIVGNNIDFYVWKRGTDIAADLGSQFVMTMQGDGAVGIGITNPVAALHLNSTTSGATLLRADGTNGTLFSVVDDLSDSLMSVNNSAGLPVLEVFADDRVVAGQYGANDFVLINNKLGLGTNSPASKLSIVGSSATNFKSLILRNSDGTVGSTVSIDLETSAGTIGDEASLAARISGIRLGGGTTGGLIFSTTNNGTLSEKVRILNNGNVGIGATSPSKNLHIRSTVAGDTGIIIENTNNAQNLDIDFWNNVGSVQGRFRYSEGAGDFSFYPNAAASEALTIKYGGNVGIGATSPGAKLDVVGSTRLTSNLLSHKVASYTTSYPGINSFGADATDANITYYDTGKLLPNTNFRGVVWTGKHYIFVTTGSNLAYFYDNNFNLITNSYGLNSVSLPLPSGYSYPHGAAWDGRYLWVVCYVDGETVASKIVGYDLDSPSGNAAIIAESAPLTNMTAAYDIEYADGHFYMVRFGSVLIYRWNGSTIDLINTITGEAGSITAQAITYDGSYLWATQNGVEIYKLGLDGYQDAVITTGFPPNVCGWAWNGSNIVTFNFSARHIYIINTTRLRIDTQKLALMGGNVGIGTASPSAVLHVYGTTFKFEDTSTSSSIRIGPMANNYPYVRFDSYVSDNSGYFWGFGQKTSAGATRVNAFFYDNNRGWYSADQLTVVTFTANEYNSSYTTFSEPIKLRASGASYFNGGNVGIGIATPGSKLHLSGTGVTELRITSTTANTNSLLSFYESSLASWGIDAGQANGSFFIKDLFNTRTVLTLNASGNVGIGTSSPTALLNTAVTGQIQIGTSNWPTTFVGKSGARTLIGNDAVLILWNDTSTIGANVEASLFLGARGSGANGATTIAGGGIRGLSEDASTNKGYLKFETNNGSGFAETMRIKSDGNVGIGTVGTTGPSNKLHVWAGTIQVSGFPSIGAGPITFLRSDYNGSAAVQINFLNFNPSNGYDSDLGIQLMNTSGSMVDVLRIKGSTGNVGIGKTNPNAKLNVLSTSSLSSVFKTEGVNGTLFEVTDDLSNSLMSVNTIGGLPVFEVFANNSIIAGQYGQNDFVISGNKVGIGTASPSYKLHVNGSLGVNAGTSDGNWPFIVVDSISSGGSNRYALNKIGAMGFNYADSYAQLQLIGANGAYIDFGNAAIDDSDARIIYHSNNRFDISYGTTITLNSTGAGVGVLGPSAKLHVQTTAGSVTAPNVVAIFQANTDTTILAGGGTAIKFRGVSSGGNVQDYDQCMISSLGYAGNNQHGMQFWVKPNAGTALTAALTIDNNSAVVANSSVTASSFIGPLTGNVTGTASVATNATQLGGAAASSYVRNDTDGTAGNVFSLITVTKSLILTTSWLDTGISGTSDLANSGAYIITMNANNYAVGGGQYNETYTGIMYWYAGGTNDAGDDEIVLHKSGHAPNAVYINLRTLRTSNGTLKLQIISSAATNAASNYIFKFRRMI